jgi:hypothetical protein
MWVLLVSDGVCVCMYVGFATTIQIVLDLSWCTTLLTLAIKIRNCFF